MARRPVVHSAAELPRDPSAQPSVDV